MISQETSKRIAKEAITKFPPLSNKYPNTNYAALTLRQGYIHGAEAWATRAEGLVEFLESMEKHPMTPGHVREKITEALNNYNKPDK